MKVTEGFRFDVRPLRRAFVRWGRGYTRMAELVGTTPQTVRNAVDGRHPTGKYLPKIAGVLGVDMGELWIEEGEA